MPKPARSAALAILSLLAATVPASALKLTNRDATEQKLTIYENNAAREQALKPAESVDVGCNAGCSIKMQDGEEYEFDGNEVASIEEGLIFLDEAPAQGAAEPAPKQ